MPDEATEDVETTPEVNESAEQAPKPSETVDFWKAKAREQEKRAKANADAALRAEREIEGFKAQVAKATGVPAEVLRGRDLDEIKAHADSLKPLLTEPRPGRVPTEGRTVTTGTGDPAHQFANILKQQLA
jgi:hypothetical protein